MTTQLVPVELEPAQATFNEEYLKFRLEIFVRDKFTCQYCNRKGLLWRGGTTMHHINGNHQDTQENNCTVACQSCNIKLGGGKCLLDGKRKLWHYRPSYLTQSRMSSPYTTASKPKPYIAFPRQKHGRHKKRWIRPD